VVCILGRECGNGGPPSWRRSDRSRALLDGSLVWDESVLGSRVTILVSGS
jgi:hypothetical protein